MADQAQKPAIIVKNLTKEFILPHKKHSSLKSLFVDFGRKGKADRRKVLNDISFTINKGEFFGIVGRNGSGKSTLLKLLAGVYTPTKGAIGVNGSLTPFIELGVGFNPELTGRENVFLNGSLLGFTHKQMEGMYSDIVDFAELHDFMDQKLKNYSSGMQVRLAFSIAIRAKSDILLIDEVLAVGDEAFQRKCNDYFTKIKNSEQTVVLVTHDMSAVKRFCNKAILIHDGDIKLSGSPEDVSNQYTLDNFSSEKKDIRKDKYAAGLSELVPNIEIKPISKQILTSKDTFEFEIRYTVTKNIPVRFGISLIDERSGGATSIFDDRPKDENGQLIATSTKRGDYHFKYAIPLRRFNNREFIITASLFRIIDDIKNVELLAYTAGEKVGHFAVRGEDQDGGLLKEKGEWLTKR